MGIASIAVQLKGMFGFLSGSSNGSVFSGITYNGKKILPTSFSLKVALGVIGQSNEQGAVLYQDSLGVWQKASVAAPSQGITEPALLNKAGFGSMFIPLTELLAQDGIAVELHNGAVGGTSYVYDWCGDIKMNGRTNSTAYRGKRVSTTNGDPGHRGDQIFVNGAVWEATTGNSHLVFYNSATASPTYGGVSYYSDPGSIVKNTSLVTAGTPPTFPGSPIVGDAVVDGSITWTCLTVGAKTTDAGNIHVLRNTEDGFDPYYMCQRVRDSLMTSSVSASKKFVYMQNGQADAGAAAAVYQMAMRMLGQYFGISPYLITPIFGLSIYYPSQLQADWDTLETVLSGSGLAGSPNYATSGLTTAITSGGFHLATPGNAITSFGFYYGQSLYRSFGITTTSMLQPSSPHVTIDGMYQCAYALYPTLSKILRNSAT
jgi:hypothetical protein